MSTGNSLSGNASSSPFHLTSWGRRPCPCIENPCLTMGGSGWPTKKKRIGGGSGTMGWPPRTNPRRAHGSPASTFIHLHWSQGEAIRGRSSKTYQRWEKRWTRVARLAPGEAQHMLFSHIVWGTGSSGRPETWGVGDTTWVGRREAVVAALGWETRRVMELRCDSTTQEIECVGLCNTLGIMP